MLKKILKEKLIQKNNDELKKAQNNLATTETLVQKGDLKSDGKYDTRATEANYLADGQRQRVKEIEHEALLLEDIPVREAKDDHVQIGSVVDIEHNNHTRTYYISPTSGGTLIEVDGNAIMVISVFSPIGKEVLDLRVGEEFEVEINNQTRLYQIKTIQ